MISKLITFGCSFTKDNYQDTWADLLSKDIGMPLLNYAERGAGSDFVVKRLLTAELDPNEDLVVIMWPSADRYDLWADSTTPHLIEDREYASWPDGIQPMFVDFYGNYYNDRGFNLNGSVPRGYKHYFFKYFFSAQQSIHNWYTNIITAQLFLEKQNIPYVMTTAFQLTNPIHYHHDDFSIVPEIYNKINLERFVDHAEHEGFLKYCETRQLPFFNSNHPNTQSHRHYIDNVLKYKVESLLK